MPSKKTERTTPKPGAVPPVTKPNTRNQRISNESAMNRDIRAALEQVGWRVSGKHGAAELLGIRPTTLADRIRSHGIKKPRK